MPYLGWCCMAWLSSRLTEMAIVRYIYRVQLSVYFSRITYLVSSVQTCSTIVYLFLNLPVKQFRALSDQFYRTPEHHRFVRQQVVNQVSIVNSGILSPLIVNQVCIAFFSVLIFEGGTGQRVALLLLLEHYILLLTILWSKLLFILLI